MKTKSWEVSDKFWAIVEPLIPKPERSREPEFKARRRVVEACRSWFNRFRKLTIRYEKLDSTHLALHHPAAAVIA
jgi:transposase